MTGLTYMLVEKNLTFEQFVMLCARQFGALVTMRDDATDAPIPKALPVDPYHETERQKAATELTRIKGLADSECEREARRLRLESKAARDEAIREATEKNNKLSAVLADAVKWTAPSEDHVRLREFVIEQLQMSKSDPARYWPEPVQQSGADWRAERIAKLTGDVAYHAEKYAEEEARTAQRNEWLRLLRESLNATGSAS